MQNRLASLIEVCISVFTSVWLFLVLAAVYIDVYQEVGRNTRFLMMGFFLVVFTIKGYAIRRIFNYFEEKFNDWTF